MCIFSEEPTFFYQLAKITQKRYIVLCGQIILFLISEKNFESSLQNMLFLLQNNNFLTFFFKICLALFFGYHRKVYLFNFAWKIKKRFHFQKQILLIYNHPEYKSKNVLSLAPQFIFSMQNAILEPHEAIFRVSKLVQ